MGHVYRATQAPMNREVAIKVLRVDLAGQEGVKERFKREARAASLIQHPNAITIFDFDEDGELLYLTMEFLSGETLRQRLRREPILTVEQALDMFESMAGALGAAHRVGVVHRDLKPDNIFLAKFDAVGEVVKVLDFGLAKLLDRAATGEEQLTDHNLRLGTPRYMAPEQALGIQPIDSRCDVYALGLLLFEMLAQRAPFVGDDGMEVLAQRLRREAPRLSQVAPQKNFGPQMDELLANMLKRDREQRPQDANVILSQVREIRKNNQVYRPLDELADSMGAGEPGRQSGGNPVVGRASMPGQMGRVTGPSGRVGAPSNTSWQSGPRQDGRGGRPEGMISLDQDDDLDKRTVVVDPGMQVPEIPAPPPKQLPQAMLDMPTAIGQLPHPGVPMPPGMGHPGVSIPPVARQAYPRPTPMPSLGEPSMDPTAQPTAAAAPPPQKNRKLQMFIVLAILAVLAPLVALLLKGLLSHGEDHGDSQVVPEIERPLKPVAPAPTRTAAAPPPTAPAAEAPPPTATPPPSQEADDATKVAASKSAEPSADDTAADTDNNDGDQPDSKPSKSGKSSKSSKSAARAKGSRNTVRIFVDSSPRKATVERDGKKIGVTPIVDSPPQGTRAVRYRILAKGYKSYEESVLPDRKRTLTAKLKPEPKT